MICCDVCHMPLTDEENESVKTIVGMSIKLDESCSSHPVYKKMKDVFHKTEFNICYCCRLLSMGVPPLHTFNLTEPQMVLANYKKIEKLPPLNPEGDSK